MGAGPAGQKVLDDLKLATLNKGRTFTGEDLAKLIAERRRTPSALELATRGPDKVLRGPNGEVLSELASAGEGDAPPVATAPGAGTSGGESSQDFNIDFAFIEGRESTTLDGYWPATGNSGATVATGFDIGQRNIQDLERLGLSPDLQERLTPYVEVTGREAEALLERQPLVITQEESDAIDAATRRQIVGELARHYDAASTVRFADLTRAQQTVITSVAWQYGPNLPAATRNFWRQVTTQDWEAARNNLLDFGDDHPTRHRIEAEYLEREERTRQ
jgi:hypothetical protein